MERYVELIDDYDAFIDACERPLPQTGRVNTVKSSSGEVRDRLGEAGFGVESLDWYEEGFRLDAPDEAKIGNTLPHYLGWIAVQEEVSMLPPVVLRESTGLGDSLVFDACAAPGSKTTQVAQDAAAVVANDDNVGRIAALRSNADRLGLTNIAVTSYDTRRFPDAVFFDAALVDVPCTSEATVRKNPGYRDGASADRRDSLVPVQKGILSRTLDLVTEGGCLVYSTCTFAPEENEAVIDHVVEKGKARVREFSVGLKSSPGVTEWQGERYSEEVEKTKRFYPHHNDTGGFYVALLEPVSP
jgi:NOL1/NOP2/sun family putative RNA methylase